MKSPEDVQDMIHEVVPTLPLPALELLEELGTIGEEAELTQELAAALAAVRRGAPTPVLSDDFADSVLGALPAGAPPVVSEPARPAAEPRLERVPANPRSGVRGGWYLAVAASFFLGLALATSVGLGPARIQPPAEGPIAEAPLETPGLTPGADELPPAKAEASDGQELDGQDLEGDPPQAEEAPELGPEALSVIANASDPVRAYVAEASMVFEALERLDTKDPRVSRALALHLERTDLLEQGERILVAIDYDPAGRRLRPLIRGTQVVLRKVRHAPREASVPLTTIRQEVRYTGLLEACRTLLADARVPLAPNQTDDSTPGDDSTPKTRPKSDTRDL